MIIDIVSDPICPWCYIGKRRLERALAQAPIADLQIGWRPFQLNPDMPLEGMDRQEYLRLKFGDRAGGNTYDAVKSAGLGEGIAFNFDGMKRTPNTLLAHRLIRFAANENRQDEMVEALFRIYFIENQDIGAVETLVQLAAALGMDTERTRGYLAGDPGSARHEPSRAIRQGIKAPASLHRRSTISDIRWTPPSPSCCRCSA
ncbi:MAG: DsbA family oxidoreductase [Proteobacteria bacterium]|nr:DsbA family oxidoreductase [Pseudomonadota bacterium]